jgi:hypothetical protein
VCRTLGRSRAFMFDEIYTRVLPCWLVYGKVYPGLMICSCWLSSEKFYFGSWDG